MRKEKLHTIHSLYVIVFDYFMCCYINFDSYHLIIRSLLEFALEKFYLKTFFFSFIFSLFHFLSVQWEAFIGFLCFSNVFRVVCRRNKFNQIKIANRQMVKKNEKKQQYYNKNQNQKKKKTRKMFEYREYVDKGLKNFML